jgi:hypothetical protein
MYRVLRVIYYLNQQLHNISRVLNEIDITVNMLCNCCSKYERKIVSIFISIYFLFAKIEVLKGDFGIYEEL